MNTPICKPVPEAQRYKRKVMRSLHYDGLTLVIEMQGEGFTFARLTFQRVVGFRMLDEGDLCAFWDSYHEKNGWLYEVEQGGWLELESTRPYFISPDLYPELREYLFVDDSCISILTDRPPVIDDLGTDPVAAAM